MYTDLAKWIYISPAMLQILNWPELDGAWHAPTNKLNPPGERLAKLNLTSVSWIIQHNLRLDSKKNTENLSVW